MYLEHFGLNEYPFSLTPDTDFFFESAGHRDALNTLHAALRLGEGFNKVTAEIGLGKTLLCRLLLRELDDSFVTAYVPDPLLSPRSLRAALARELSIEGDDDWQDERLLHAIQSRLVDIAKHGRRTVLLIDEAHELPRETLESVRLLTNLETEKSKLLQVVIIGQPELDRRLGEPGLRQLRQRIGFACTLQPLTASDTATYIGHRASRAGARAAPLFSAAAVAHIFRASRGTPRLVNLLCHKSLLVAFGNGAAQVSVTHARRAASDSLAALGSLRGQQPRWWRFGRLLAAPGAAALPAGHTP